MIDYEGFKLSATEYYAKKVPPDQEEKYVEESCAEECSKERSTVVTECSAREADIMPYFRGAKPVPGAFSHLTGQAAYSSVNVPCWAALPKLSLAYRPPSYVGEIVSRQVLNSPCFKCRLDALVRHQSQNGFGPDKRFWVGVGAASVAVLLAVVVGATRR
jgi:hypothetical protein